MINFTTDSAGGNVLYLDGHVAFNKNLPNISLLLK
jgi:prepilin-type processing-associated H-X9-DG protein